MPCEQVYFCTFGLTELFYVLVDSEEFQFLSQIFTKVCSRKHAFIGVFPQLGIYKVERVSAMKKPYPFTINAGLIGSIIIKYHSWQVVPLMCVIDILVAIVSANAELIKVCLFLQLSTQLRVFCRCTFQSNAQHFFGTSLNDC